MRLLLVLLMLLTAAPAAAEPVLGVYSEEPLSTDPEVRTRATADQFGMGFQAVRQPWSWKEIEAARGVFDWTRTDEAVTATYLRGLTILPFLVDPPAWAVDQPPGETGTRPPRDNADMAAFAAALVRRYGPGGAFWRRFPAAHAVPIRDWQIWNEPNLATFWRPAPDAAAYVGLLRTIRDAIHAVDPGATVISAGLPDSSGGVDQLTYLRDLYRGGLHESTDAVAVHAYAPDVAGIVALVSEARRVMRRRGDGAVPLWVTEYGFATGGEASLFTVTEAQQAALLTRATGMLRGLAAPLGLGGVFLFSWRDPRERFLGLDIWPYHAGLLRGDGSPKPVMDPLWVALRAPVTPAPPTPARLRMRTRLTRHRLTVRCSAACSLGAVLIGRVARAGRPAQSVVVGRWTRALPRNRAGRLRIRRRLTRDGVSLRLQISAVAASGAAARRTLTP